MTTNSMTTSAGHGSGQARVTPVSMALRIFKRVRTSGSLLIFGLVTTLSCVPAAAYDQQALNTADTFLRTAERGKEVLSYVHFGADYHGHKYLNTLSVDDGRGAFALVYRFWWEDDGVTDAAFLCDARGFVYGVRIVWTNAVLSQPFLVANASIAVLGHGLIELYKDKLSDQDRRQLHDIVNRADARGLLEFSLKLQQVFP